MSDAINSTDVRAQYVDRISEDLAQNERERKRIAQEVAVLQNELFRLESDHVALEGMLRSLSSTSSPELPAPEPQSEVLAEAAGSAAAAVSGPDRTGKRKQAPRVPSQETTTQGKPRREDTIAERILWQLITAPTPRSASEITSALHESDSTREFNPKVVRNALEFLVAKGRVERARQKRSVFYTAVTEADSPVQ